MLIDGKVDNEVEKKGKKALLFGLLLVVLGTLLVGIYYFSNQNDKVLKEETQENDNSEEYIPKLEVTDELVEVYPEIDSDESIGQIKKKEIYQIINHKDGWYEIVFNDKVGFIKENGIRELEVNKSKSLVYVFVGGEDDTFSTNLIEFLKNEVSFKDKIYLKIYKVKEDKLGKVIYQKYLEEFMIDGDGTPLLVLNGNYMYGYNDSMKQDYELFFETELKKNT